MALTVTARIQQVPPDNAGGHQLSVDTLTVQADDYPTAQTVLRTQLPAGWRVIDWTVDRG